MADYGVVNSGFVRKRLPEQLQEIYSEMKAGFGDDISLEPDTVLGVLSNITAERFSAMWEELEDVYLQMYPMSATGYNLDRAASFTGVTRLQEQPSSVGVVWYGAEGTVIPDYTSVRNVNSQVLYFNNGEFTISKSKAYDVIISPANSKVNTGETIALMIDGVTYRYTTNRSSAAYAIEELGKILKGVNYINTTTNGVEIRITASTVEGFDLELVSGLKLDKLGVMNDCLTEGASLDYAAKGEVSEIVSTVTGLNLVNNLTDGTRGRFEETDSELYARYSRGVYHTGAGTSESIYANLMKVKGVSSALVYENDQKTIDEYNTPANSIHCIVRGGLDAEIAETILALKPAGISTHGNVSVRVKDSQNINRTVKFSRPKEKYIWVKVVAQTFVDQNELAKSGYIVNITNNIMNYGNSLSVGADVILQRIIAECVKIDGVNSVDVSIGVTNTLTDSEPVYSKQDIKIAPDEEAIFDKSIVVVS